MAWLKLADMTLSLGNYLEAIEACQEVLRTEPNEGQALLLLGQAFSELGQEDEADRWFEKLLEQNPALEDVFLHRALSLQSQGRFDLAAEQFEKALKIRPEQGFAYYGLVSGRRITQEDRSLVERMEALEASDTLGDSEAAQLQYALGKALDNLGEYEAALGHFDQANEIVFRTQMSRRAFDQKRFSEQIDAAIQIFTKDRFEKGRSNASDSQRPLFVVGMLRSGTTLTEQILSSHPDIAGAGELPFWMANEHSLIDYSGSKVKDHKVQYAAKQYLEILESVDSSALRVTDKNPANVLALGLIHLAFPNAKIIHTMRHPVDTFLSIYMTPVRTPPEFACNRENIVFAYEQYLRLMEHWRSVIPQDSLLEIRYEDLVANKEGVTRQMVEFVGLPWTSDCLHHEENRRTVRTPSFWQVRQPMYSSSVGRWKHYLPWLGAFAKYAVD